MFDFDSCVTIYLPIEKRLAILKSYRTILVLDEIN